MTDINQSGTAYGSSEASGGTADVAREQAAHVAETAQESGQHVVETAKEEAASVAQEAKSQVGDLLSQTQQELKDQAARQQERVAAGLRSVSDELGEMARSSQSGGMATDLVHQASAKTGEVASWLDQRDPGSLLDEARSFARRRPGTFIAAAAIAGVLAGRLTRSVAGASSTPGSTAGSTPGSTSDAAGGSAAAEDVPPPVMRTPQARIVPATAEDASGGLDDLGTTGTDWR
ncbi:hypothetical protein ACFVWR_15700 [Leifsonia sp. NPDC058292]|uniref:hypothetical protein n=1 Tax=Leifsonia sp. NPDC058292 TaxID=3346428 RepID=UPI0036D80B0F